MKSAPVRVVLICGVAVAFAPAASAPAAGPDIIVGEIAFANDIIRHGTVGHVTAYSFRTTACNIGTSPANWISNTNQHPVISQNMYRLNNGWFHQIGMAWLKHGFGTENNELAGCGTCTPTGGQTLGVGCADTYSAVLNGAQILLGPPSQVNPSTGFFPYPFTAPPIESILSRRMQVRNRFLDPTDFVNVGARYVIESQYVAADDAAFGNSENNASWRQVNVSLNAGNFDLAPTGPTMRMEPAIFAWKAFDPDVKLTQVIIENDGATGFRGYMWVGARVTYAGDCTWIYDYAVQNLNSHQACGRFAVHYPPGAEVFGGASVHPRHHSGENFIPFSWFQTLLPDALVFETFPFQQYPNSNAIWWNTLHNFRVYASAPPQCDGVVELTLFRSPDRPPIFVETITPGLGDPCPKLDEQGQPIIPDCNDPPRLKPGGVFKPALADSDDSVLDGKDAGAIQSDPQRIKD